MESKQLRYFVTVVDMKSFSRAAKQLFVSQPALSSVIRNMEKEYGVQLIYFLGKQMHLTSHGTQLYAMAQNMLRQQDAIHEMMHGSFPMEKGILRIGLSHTMGPCLFPRLVSGFLEKYPDIEYVVEQYIGLKEIQDMVNKHQLDVGFVLLPVLANAFDVVPIHKSSRVIIASKRHPLAQRESLRFADLRDERFIMLGPLYRGYHEFLAGCRSAGFEPRIAMQLAHWDLIFQLVKLNMGITCLVKLLIETFPSDELVSIPVVDPVPSWEAVMITAKNRYDSIPLRLFKEHVQAVVGTE